ncbi:hypothetical protein [Frigidibacter sp. MR17.24]|uniref:hypothetical protein n=1 Tax=Frigidibacter sp. MR17.24 TaxID=3127345 RepID=UPI003012EB53
MATTRPENATTEARLARIEGMQLAQRRLLVRLCAGSPIRPEIEAWLADRSAFQGGDEDPGLLPSPEFALQAAMAEEFRRLAAALADLPAPGRPVTAD